MTDAIEHLGWDLWQCARGWTSLFVAEMHAQGYTDFSLPRANVLAYVQRDGSSRAVDIANATGLTKQAVNQTLDELVDCGLIERLPDPSDGRAKRIAFTPRGRCVYQRRK